MFSSTKQSRPSRVAVWVWVDSLHTCQLKCKPRSSTGTRTHLKSLFIVHMAPRWLHCAVHSMSLMRSMMSFLLIVAIMPNIYWKVATIHVFCDFWALQERVLRTRIEVATLAEWPVEFSLERGTLYVFHLGPSESDPIDGHVKSRCLDAVQEQKLDPTNVRKRRGPPCGISGILHSQRVSAC